MAQEDHKDEQTHWTIKISDLRKSIQPRITEHANAISNTLKEHWTSFPARCKELDKNFRWSIIATVLVLISCIFIGLWDSSPPPFSGDINFECQSPRVIKSWHTRAFRPNWFRLFGGPVPLTYKTKGRKGHRISVVDIDKRDVEIRVWVDDRDLGYRPVELNDSIDCGEDVWKCITEGFSATMITVPPGKHVFKAEIVDPKGTFKWRGSRKRRVMWQVEQCS